MAKNKKEPRPKAETPKGFRDYFGQEVTERAEMLDRIAAVYSLYGFEALESSAVETLEALGKYLPDVDRPHAGVFAWQEEDAGWLALRYDLTAPLARVFAEHRNELPTPYRRYAMGPVWRNEKPGPGRFRQFYQCDADTVGTASVAADAEICMMLADALDEVGLERHYVIRVNNRKVLNGVLESSGIDESDHVTRGRVLRTLDKIDKFDLPEIRKLLGTGRKDESGDFTEGAGLSADQIEGLASYIETGRNVVVRATTARLAVQTHRATVALTEEFTHNAKLDPDTEETLRSLKDAVGDSSTGVEGVSELQNIARFVRASGYGPDRIVIDPSVVRGLGYYTGPVFEAELTFEITDENGRPRQFGSVAGGGRYDDLVKRFTGQAVPATGISIGVDRLLAALREKGRIGGAPEGPVVVTVMDRDRMSDYQAMAAELRSAGIRAEVYLGNPKNFGNQLKYADRRNSPVAIIEGADEKARGVVQVKDLVLGAKFAETATHEEWKDQPAQFECPRERLVAEVRRVLGSR